MVKLRNVNTRKVYTGAITHDPTCDRLYFHYYDPESMSWNTSALQTNYPRTLLWVPEDVAEGVGR